jgi:putative transposase
LETRRWNGNKSAFADYAAAWLFVPTLTTAAIMRSYAEIYLHLVWATWDRHPLLTGDRLEAVYRAIHHECIALGAQVIAIGGMEDHVHLLVRVPASLSASDLVKQVKGASTYMVNPAHGREAPFRWQGRYGAFSVSRHHVERVRGYVLNQEGHHRSGQTAIHLEPPAYTNNSGGPQRSGATPGLGDDGLETRR